MKTTLVINDLHLGVARSAGTTPASAAALKQYLIQQFRDLLHNSEGRTIINGDLTDQFDIPLGEALDTYQVIDEWLGGSSAREVVVALGNHDLSKDSSKLGTVQFIGRLLELKYPEQFRLVKKPVDVGDDIYIIPHLTNQDLFDHALDNVPDGTKYLLLHANYDNPFAGQQDHSLNVERSRAKALIDRGVTLIFGHEHQGRTAFAGGVQIVGNQFPSSVSDCLTHGDGQTDGKKYALRLSTDGLERVQTWRRTGDYGLDEIDWRDLSGLTESRKFVRVTGDAEADEAADVIKAIASFRQRSDAFVITNAVKVSQLADTGELEVSAEDVRSVNVIDMLLQSLTEEQAATVRQLMEKNK